MVWTRLGEPTFQNNYGAIFLCSFTLIKSIFFRSCSKTKNKQARNYYWNIHGMKHNQSFQEAWGGGSFLRGLSKISPNSGIYLRQGLYAGASIEFGDIFWKAFVKNTGDSFWWKAFWAIATLKMCELKFRTSELIQSPFSV